MKTPVCTGAEPLNSETAGHNGDAVQAGAILNLRSMSYCDTCKRLREFKRGKCVSCFPPEPGDEVPPPSDTLLEAEGQATLEGLL